MFIDHIRIFGKAGDGGAGGDIVLVVDNSVDNLRAYHYDPKLIAEDGKNGAGGRKTGKSGKRVIGRVLLGTVKLFVRLKAAVVTP